MTITHSNNSKYSIQNIHRRHNGTITGGGGTSQPFFTQLPVVGDCVYFGIRGHEGGHAHDGLNIPSDATPILYSGGVVTGVWEYWVGDVSGDAGWSQFAGVVDNTAGLTVVGQTITWDHPGNWGNHGSTSQPAVLNMHYRWWVRFRITSTTATTLINGGANNATPIYIRARDILITAGPHEVADFLATPYCTEISKGHYLIDGHLRTEGAGRWNITTQARIEFAEGATVQAQTPNTFDMGQWIELYFRGSRRSLFGSDTLISSGGTIRKLSIMTHPSAQGPGDGGIGSADLAGVRGRFRHITAAQPLRKVSMDHGHEEGGAQVVEEISSAGPIVIRRTGIASNSIHYDVKNTGIGYLIGAYNFTGPPGYLINHDAFDTSKLVTWEGSVFPPLNDKWIDCGHQVRSPITDTDGVLLADVALYLEEGPVTLVGLNNGWICIDEGTLTAATADSLTDSSKAYSVAEIEGRRIRITSGAAAGEERIIRQGESGDTWQVNRDFDNLPAAGDKYVILPHIIRYKAFSTGSTPSNVVDQGQKAVRILSYGYQPVELSLTLDGAYEIPTQLKADGQLAAPDAATALLTPGIVIDYAQTPVRCTISQQVTTAELYDFVVATAAANPDKPFIYTPSNGVVFEYDMDIYLDGADGIKITGTPGQSISLGSNTFDNSANIHAIADIPITDAIGTTSILKITGVTGTVRDTIHTVDGSGNITATLYDADITADKVHMLGAALNGISIKVVLDKVGFAPVIKVDTAQGTTREVAAPSIAGLSMQDARDSFLLPPTTGATVESGSIDGGIGDIQSRSLTVANKNRLADHLQTTHKVTFSSGAIDSAVIATVDGVPFSSVANKLVTNVLSFIAGPPELERVQIITYNEATGVITFAPLKQAVDDTTVAMMF